MNTQPEGIGLKSTAASQKPRSWVPTHPFRFIIRLVLGGVFLYSGSTKIFSSLEFADSIASFQLFPTALINLIALVLPPFEVLLGAALLVGYKKRAAVLGMALLCVVFVSALGLAILRGIEVDCGCFGSGEPSGYGAIFSFARAFALLCASAWLYRTLWRSSAGVSP